MGKYFKPRRRKTGCATLVVALLFVLGWGRSYSFKDDIVIEDAGFVISSAKGEVSWNWNFRVEVRTAPVRWWTNPISKINPAYFTEEYRTPERVPYWCLAIPLTLLSAALLLMPIKRTDQELQTGLANPSSRDAARGQN